VSTLGDLLEQLDREDLERLAERLRPYLRADEPTTAPAVYTPQTLAVELGITARAVRAAIDRGDLEARRSGRGYVIGAEAVAVWASAAPRRRRHPSARASRTMRDAIGS
jgi:excisionase family DNA binding protein